MKKNGQAWLLAAVCLTRPLWSEAVPGSEGDEATVLSQKLLSRDVHERTAACHGLKLLGWASVAPVVRAIGKPGGEIFYPAVCHAEILEAITGLKYTQPNTDAERIRKLGAIARHGAIEPDETGGIGLFGGSTPIPGGPAAQAGFPSSGWIDKVEGRPQNGLPELEPLLRGPANSTVTLRVREIGGHSKGAADDLEILIKRREMFPSTNQVLNLLRMALADESPQVRVLAIVALGEAGTTFKGQTPSPIAHTATAMLIPLLNDKSKEVVVAAKEAIQSTGTTQGKAALANSSRQSK